MNAAHSSRKRDSIVWVATPRRLSKPGTAPVGRRQHAAEAARPGDADTNPTRPLDRPTRAWLTDGVNLHDLGKSPGVVECGRTKKLRWARLARDKWGFIGRQNKVLSSSATPLRRETTEHHRATTERSSDGGSLQVSRWKGDERRCNSL